MQQHTDCLSGALRNEHLVFGLCQILLTVKLALPFLECIDFVGELSGVDEASKDVVGEVAESKRDSAEVF